LVLHLQFFSARRACNSGLSRLSILPGLFQKGPNREPRQISSQRKNTIRWLGAMPDEEFAQREPMPSIAVLLKKTFLQIDATLAWITDPV